MKSVIPDRRLLLWGCAIFLVSLALSLVQIVPVPEISIKLKTPRRVAHRPYAPAYRIDAETDLIMVYIGSHFCAASNDAALPLIVEDLKRELLAQATEWNIGFSAVGVAVDWHTRDGLKHLEKNGTFDEIMAGRSWHSLGARYFAREVIVGRPATPQVLVYIRRKRTDSEGGSTIEKVVLARKIGVSDIRRWIDRGLPIPTNLAANVLAPTTIP